MTSDGDGIETIYLLGMGGSALCAEVMRAIYGVRPGYPSLVVMDTTDEAAISAAVRRLEPEQTLFLVASKSGGTIEPASMERLFWDHMSSRLGDRAGRHFIAVTDPATGLAQLAAERGYRHVFLNPPDIGGRFSALVAVRPRARCADWRARARDARGRRRMAEGCRQENHQNAGLELGAFFGAAANTGRDKLTLILPPSLRSLGLWIEQLVAESTGKQGKGSLPVVDEPLGRPDDYNDDRCFVAISTDRDAPDRSRIDALEAAGHPVLRLSTRLDGLGAEFFRWEFATAIAGSILGINPFDEPNVAEAKDKTRASLSKGTIDSGKPAATAGTSLGIFTAHRPDTRLHRPHRPRNRSVRATTSRSSRTCRQNRNSRPLLAPFASPFGSERARPPRSASDPATCTRPVSTTRAGRTRSSPFVITGEDLTSTAIPGAPYTFAQLKRAQAIGDAETLEAHGRRTVRIHMGKDTDASSALRELFAEAMK